MLEHLHVKNLALIREAEIDFTEGLNILTRRDRSRKIHRHRLGEPGAGRQGQ